MTGNGIIYVLLSELSTSLCTQSLSGGEMLELMWSLSTFLVNYPQSGNLSEIQAVFKANQ